MISFLLNAGVCKSWIQSDTRQGKRRKTLREEANSFDVSLLTGTNDHN